MQNAGIFGTTLSGKTTLAKALSKQFWQSAKMRTLVLDPLKDNWGNHAMPFEDEETFWQSIWKVKNCLVIVDEAGSTINRNRELKPVFTRLRHCGHKLIVIGHSSTDLLPVMRQSLDTLFLFRHSPKAAGIWAETFTNEDILQASELNQYEYLFCRLYHKSEKRIVPFGGNDGGLRVAG